MCLQKQYAVGGCIRHCKVLKFIKSLNRIALQHEKHKIEEKCETLRLVSVKLAHHYSIDFSAT